MTARAIRAIAAGTVFDGCRLHRDRTVIVDGTRIAALVPRLQLPPGMPVHALPDGAWLAPGFIDCQVNGGGDVLFNDAPT
ncbi:MAG TPA: N-acetylglucosamine-6-phosphate deacetylase, partial [Hyphomicrobiaceae bacterium]